MRQRVFFITSALLTISLLVNAQTRKELKALYNSQYSYEVMCLGVGIDGTKAVKVYAFGKTAEIAAYNARRDAVAAAIFKGIPGGGGAAPTPAIIGPDGYDKNEDFFDEFFKAGGMYLSFINLTSDAPPSGADRIKMEKGYKVAIYASINFDSLRKYLEDKGVARKLDSGF